MKTYEIFCHIYKINVRPPVLTNVQISLMKSTTRRNAISIAFQQCVDEEDPIKFHLTIYKIRLMSRNQLQKPHMPSNTTLLIQLRMEPNYLQKKYNVKDIPIIWRSKQSKKY